MPTNAHANMQALHYLLGLRDDAIVAFIEQRTDSTSTAGRVFEADSPHGPDKLIFCWRPFDTVPGAPPAQERMMRILSASWSCTQQHNVFFLRRIAPDILGPGDDPKEWPPTDACQYVLVLKLG